jgi:hypothetical protein
MAFTVEQLHAGLQSLPQELFDEIFKLTFTHNADQIFLTKDYRPPSQLQVSHQTRKDFIRSYYGETKLISQVDYVVRVSAMWEAKCLGSWLSSLSKNALHVLANKQSCPVRREPTVPHIPHVARNLVIAGREGYFDIKFMPMGSVIHWRDPTLVTLCEVLDVKERMFKPNPLWKPFRKVARKQTWIG